MKHEREGERGNELRMGSWSGEGIGRLIRSGGGGVRPVIGQWSSAACDGAPEAVCVDVGGSTKMNHENEA